MLFWLTSVGDFVVLASLIAAGFYFGLNQNLVGGASTVIIIVAIWLGVLAAREEGETRSTCGLFGPIPAG